MTVADVLALYGEEHAPTVAAPERLGYAISALLPFWGGMTVAQVTGATCRRYARERGVAPGTSRRELNVLQAAINYCHREGCLLDPRKVVLPEKSQPRDDWRTRDEVAQMIRAARKLNKDGRHLARFILVSVYTGTRKSATLALELQPCTHAGWIDVDRGVLHRKGRDERATNKRRGSAKIPRQLLGHARRWKKLGNRYAVQTIRGERVGDIRKAWAGMKSKLEFNPGTPHVLKHTAITWAMQRGASLTDAASYFDTSVETLQRNYWHHHTDYQESAVRAMEGR